MERIDKPQNPPPNYLIWAILTTIFCCLPFGIISIVFAAQVNTKWQTGDYDGALNASRNAKTWAWVSFGVSIVIFIISFALISMGIIAAFWTDVFDF